MMDWLEALYRKWLTGMGLPDTLTTYLRTFTGKSTVLFCLILVSIGLWKLHQYRPVPWAWILYGTVSGFILGHIFWP